MRARSVYYIWRYLFIPEHMAKPDIDDCEGNSSSTQYRSVSTAEFGPHCAAVTRLDRDYGLTLPTLLVSTAAPTSSGEGPAWANLAL